MIFFKTINYIQWKKIVIIFHIVICYSKWIVFSVLELLVAQKQDKSSPGNDDVVCKQLHTAWETRSFPAVWWLNSPLFTHVDNHGRVGGIFRDFWSRVKWGACQKVSILDTGEVSQVCPFGKEKRLTVPAWRMGYTRQHVGTIAPHHLGSFRRNKSEHQWMLKCMQYIKKTQHLNFVPSGLSALQQPVM